MPFLGGQETAFCKECMNGDPRLSLGKCQDHADATQDHAVTQTLSFGVLDPLVPLALQGASLMSTFLFFCSISSFERYVGLPCMW